ncbi:MAG TPA: response regulator transcription factor [Verrucomicrobiae bacterium]|nr:response regulator transcription factor [Verrucomicrobiae bacterium]
MTAKTKVLIVDDHPVFRHGLKEIIDADQRFEVVAECSDGAAALAIITKVRPQVAILDINLPKGNGLLVARALRAVKPPVACLMLTMNAEESTFNAAMDAGAQGYLLKEDAMDLVLLGLKTVAAGGVYLSPSISSWFVRRQHRASAFKAEKKGLLALTATERHVLSLVAENKTNKEIASEMFISHRTVETHRSSICQKLELSGAHKLLQFAMEHRSEL